MVAAVAALDQSVQRIEGWGSESVKFRGFAADADVMVERMLDEGQRALGEGRSWSARVGEVEMQLVPDLPAQQGRSGGARTCPKRSAGHRPEGPTRGPAKP
ncbi:hypothetical protein, partial [Streptomyces sp. NPDC054854]